MSGDHPILSHLKKPMMRLVKNPLDVDRSATAAEIRACNAMLAEITHENDGAAVMDGFSVLTPINQRRILMQVRAVIWSLKHVDQHTLDEMGKSDIQWCVGDINTVMLYIDSASPMDKSNN